jgi:hypothetical protein
MSGVVGGWKRLPFWMSNAQLRGNHCFVQRVVSSFGKSDEAYRVPMAFSVELHNYENFNI